MKRLFLAMAKAVNSWPYFMSFLIFAGFVILNLFLFWPGFMSGDSISQYSQAVRGQYNDWHPPLMSFIANQIGVLIPIPQGVLIFQILLIWLPFYALFLFFKSKLPPSKAITLLLIPFFPSIFNFSGVLWKDVHMGAACFGAWVSIYLLFRGKMRNLYRTALVVVAIVLLFYAQSVRQNGVLFTFFAFWALTFAVKKSHCSKVSVDLKSFVGALLLATIGLGVERILSYSYLRAEKRYPFQYVQIYDLVGVSHFLGRSVLPSYLSVTNGCPFEGVISKYSVNNGNDIFWSEACNINFLNDANDVKLLSKDWIKTIITYPMDYLKHRSAVFLGFLRLGTITTYYAMHDGIVSNDFGLKNDMNLFRTIVFRVYQKLEDTPFYYPWVYLILSGLLFKCSIKSSNRLFFSLLAVGSVIYVMGYLVVGPASDFRYVYPIPITIVTFLYVLYLESSAKSLILDKVGR